MPCLMRSLLMTLVACALVGCAAKPDAGAEEDQIRSLRQSLARAANARDFDGMKRFLAPEITLEDQSGRRTVSRAEYLDKYRGYALKNNLTFNVQIDRIEVRGDTAITHVVKRATIRRVTPVTGEVEEAWRRKGASWELTGMRSLSAGQEAG